MPRSLFALLLTVLFADASVRAQPLDADPGRFVTAGPTALSFSASWLQLGAFQGGVGGRHWFTDRTVGFVSVGLLGFSRDLEPGGRPDTLGSGVIQTTTGREVRLSLGAERHLAPTHRVSPFVAASAVLERRSRLDRGESSFMGITSRTDRREVGNGLGAALALGAEFRVLPNLSLAASHDLRLIYRMSEARIEHSVDGEPTGPARTDRASELQYGTGTTSLVLSVYF